VDEALDGIEGEAVDDGQHVLLAPEERGQEHLVKKTK